MVAGGLAMKALEFQSQLNSDKSLPVPSAIAQAIPEGQKVRVLVLLTENTEEEQWEQQAALEFGKGYADGDAIYDQLSNG
jgi:hypothetical protein